MITASMHTENAGESLSALRFGARASLVQNMARQNVAENARELKKLLEQAREDLSQLRACCRRLQAELTASRWSNEPGSPCGERSSSAKRLMVWGLLPSLVCPINRAVMRDPVLAADGWTYERRALEKYMARPSCHGLPKSPVTGDRFSTRQVTPNLVVRQLINQHLPELGPLEDPLPLIQLLHVWHVQLILSFLDARSLARCESAWPSFLAAADSSEVWVQLLQNDFNEESDTPRKAYGVLALEALAKQPAHAGQPGATLGLKLFKPRARME